MAIVKKGFGEYRGQTVHSYTLTNNNGLEAEILTFGGIIRRLVYRGIDVVLGRNNMEEYSQNEGYFGAIIGRNSNRIVDAQFCLGNTIYGLARNDNNNNLHGGDEGFDKKVWEATEIDGVEPELILKYVSPDGEEGFPGEVRVTVSYKLTEDNSVVIHYQGISNLDTVLNMTNHTYFNLNGHNSGVIDGHKLCLDSDFYTPNNSECVPTGEVLSVKGTTFDLDNKIIGDCFLSNHEQIQMFSGFDHNFVLNGRGYRKVANLTGDKTGISMEIYTDQIGMQIYSGNVIEEGCVCKDGAIYGKHHGICFETQSFPNSINTSHFPSAVLRKGEKYDTVTSFKFI